MVGLKGTDYPFNTTGRAIRSLSGLLKAEMLRSFGLAARSAGASHLKGLPHREGSDGCPAAIHPYQIVEFDGHRLDRRLKLVVRDPLGFEHEFEIERVWLLVIIDVCTRAVLGYHLVLAREYSRYDVIKTIEKALEPHRPRVFSIDGLGYETKGGLPSQRWPELSYVNWEWMKLDNAKANLANDTLRALCEFIGCLVDAGPRYCPDERPYIERFFGTLAQRLSSRLPGYTGSHPRDLRRALADPKGKLRLYVSLDELEELVEYAITTYNGTPHTGLNNATPLEAIEYYMSGIWSRRCQRRMMLSMATSITPNSRSFPSGTVFYTWVKIRCKNQPWVGQDSVQINRRRSSATFVTVVAVSRMAITVSCIRSKPSICVQRTIARSKWHVGAVGMKRRIV